MHTYDAQISDLSVYIKFKSQELASKNFPKIEKIFSNFLTDITFLGMYIGSLVNNIKGKTKFNYTKPFIKNINLSKLRSYSLRVGKENFNEVMLLCDHH